MPAFKPSYPPYMQAFMQLLRAYFRPVFCNLDSLDLTRPALFVGNHNLYAIDVPLLLDAIQRKHQVHLRALGDRVHLEIPIWRDILSKGGMLEGTPENCHHLMQQGESILVFPGGSREVMRRKDDGYDLFWKKRSGFARMALQHGYDIIPFAAVGVNECFDIHYDANDIAQLPITQFLVKHFNMQDRVRGGDLFIPIVTGLGWSTLPRPERFYFSFAQRIATAHLTVNDENIWQLREQTRLAVEQQIDDLLRLRAQDREQHWSWLRRKLT